LKETILPEILPLIYHKRKELRYGENPHQKAGVYVDPISQKSFLFNLVETPGKELSYNNLLDLKSAWNVVKEFRKPTCCIVKHASPCGVGCEESAFLSFKKALLGDTLSAYGGVLAFNCSIDILAAKAISSEGAFFEALIAPEYEDGVEEILIHGKAWGKTLRMLKAPKDLIDQKYFFISIDDGVILQTSDETLYEKLESVTFEPTSQEMLDLIFAWKVVKHVKSNGIVLAKGEMTVGIGGGQPSRIDAVKLAITKAGERAKGSVLASDGFFPFKDGLELAIKAGIRAVIQPGGSVRDREIIECARRYNIPMIFTGTRHFKH
jgi:phosphoribosylaminoimidazolecarboxamide formyltransferase/IMP cyclohydrolase